MKTFYTLKECEKRSGINRKTLRELEKKRLFPQGTVMGTGRLYYSPLVDNWLSLKKEGVQRELLEAKMRSMDIFSIANYQKVISLLLTDGYGVKSIDDLVFTLDEIKDVSESKAVPYDVLKKITEASLNKNKGMLT